MKVRVSLHVYARVRASLKFRGFVADVALSQKLQEELSYEKETGGVVDEVPQLVKDFEAQGIWTVSHSVLIY